jgi:hypothetical protein
LVVIRLGGSKNRTSAVIAREGQNNIYHDVLRPASPIISPYSAGLDPMVLSR